MRINATGLPGVQVERCEIAWTNELHREAVWLDGELIGHVSYLDRPAPVTGTEYGWKPDRPGRWSLYTKTDAIRHLIQRWEK